MLGRFISPDSIVQSPYDPQSLNRYAYCRNNPVKYIDPSGHVFEYVAGDVWMWGPGTHDLVYRGPEVGTPEWQAGIEYPVLDLINDPVEIVLLAASEEGEEGAGNGDTNPKSSDYYRQEEKEKNSLVYKIIEAKDTFYKKYIPNLNKAEEIAKEVAEKHKGWNDESDAIRHAEWSKRMHEEINPTTSYIAGIGHEIEGVFNRGADISIKQYINESRMDLNNNQEGRKAAKEGRDININNLTINPTQNKGPY